MLLTGAVQSQQRPGVPMLEDQLYMIGRAQEEEIKDLRRQIEELKKKVDELSKNDPPRGPNSGN